MSIARNPLTPIESFNYKGINFVMFAYKARASGDDSWRCWVTIRPSPSADSDLHNMTDEDPLTPRDWSQNRGSSVAVADAASPNQPYDDDQLNKKKISCVRTYSPEKATSLNSLTGFVSKR